MTSKRLLLTSWLVLLPIVLAGQGPGVAPTELGKPLADSWPTISCLKGRFCEWLRAVLTTCEVIFEYFKFCGHE